jgi:hypothetical protein
MTLTFFISADTVTDKKNIDPKKKNNFFHEKLFKKLLFFFVVYFEFYQELQYLIDLVVYS